MDNMKKRLSRLLCAVMMSLVFCVFLFASNSVFADTTGGGWVDPDSTGTEQDRVIEATGTASSTDTQSSSGLLSLTGSYWTGLSDIKHSFTLQNIASSAEDEVGRLSLGWDTLELLSLSSDGNLTVNGIIESTTGGIKFPDGTIQTTAGTGLWLQTDEGGNGYFSIGETVDGDTVGIININKYLEVDGSSNVTLNSLLAEYSDNITSSESRTILSGPSKDIVPTGYEGSLHTNYGYFSSTSGNYDTFIGAFSGFYNTTGAYNTFMGDASGLNNTTGNSNTFQGYRSGYSNTTGNQNTFIGYASGLNNTTGNSNTFMGYRSGNSNTTGYTNTFQGYYSGYANTTGNFNIFQGYQSGYSNTTGSDNTANGSQALSSNTTGGRNTANGGAALSSNTTGSDNTANGYRTLYSNTTGRSNTANGSWALSNNTTGYNNTAIGILSGYWNQGSRNVFLGYEAGYYETGSNKLYIANSLTNPPLIYGDFTSGDVGMGTNIPNEELHIYREATETILLAETNTGAGAGFQFIHGTSGGNWKAKITLDGDFKVRNHADSVDIMRFDKANNYVGIRMPNPSYELDVNGTIRGNNVSPSDVRLKEDIHTIENALEKVSALRGVSYRWIDKGDGKDAQIGVIAQEVEKVIPEVVSEDMEGIKSVSYGKLVGVLIEATKELKAEKDAEIAALKAENGAVKKDNAFLMSENKQLRKTLTSLTDRQDDIEDMLLAMSTTLPKEKLAKLECTGNR